MSATPSTLALIAKIYLSKCKVMDVKENLHWKITLGYSVGYLYSKASSKSKIETEIYHRDSRHQWLLSCEV